MGALLLIVVVIVAVASLASFIAIAQANAQNRSAFITSVNNEKLQVTFGQFRANVSESRPVVSNTATTITTPAFNPAPSGSGGDAFKVTVARTSTAGSTATVLMDSLATFTANAFIGSTLTYTAGPADGESRPIVSNTPTTITTAAFSPAPSPSGDNYVVTLRDTAKTGATTGATTTVLTDAGATFTAAQVGEALEYTSGPASGQSQVILSQTMTTLTTGTFNPAPSASGDTYVVTRSTATTAGSTSTVLTDSNAGFPSLSPGYKITYDNGPATGVDLWNNVTLTIRNTNTASSQLTQVKAGSYWFAHWNQIDPTTGQITTDAATGNHVLYGIGKAPLLIPARATVGVLLNFTENGQIPPARNSSVSITLLTSVGNFFNTVYTPPTAVGKVGIGSVNYQYFSRDVVSLDGSQSQGSNGSQIASYVWSVSVAKNGGASSCGPGAFGLSANYTRVLVFGKVSQFYQESSPFLLGSSPSSYCLAGPFKVSFSVIDTRGMIGNASSVILTSDANMAPFATLTAMPLGSLSCSSSPPKVVTVTIQDVFGRNKGPLTMIASHTGDLNASSSYTIGESGTRRIFLTCSVSSSITFSLNGLPSSTIFFSP